jgi:hypothetical protein
MASQGGRAAACSSLGQWCELGSDGDNIVLPEGCGKLGARPRQPSTGLEGRWCPWKQMGRSLRSHLSRSRQATAIGRSRGVDGTMYGG